MKVEVVKYNPRWPDQFEEIKESLAAKLNKDNIAYDSIEHVGSTSISNMPAKPIIDIDIVVDQRNLDAAISVFTGGSTTITTPEEYLNEHPQLLPTLRTNQSISATYIYRGDMGIPDRHALSYIPHLYVHQQHSSLEPLPSPSKPRHNLYICIRNSTSLKNHLLLRDLCITNPLIHSRYAETKIALSQRHDWRDVNEYAGAKTGIITWILGHAAMTAEEIRGISAVNLPVPKDEDIADDWARNAAL